MSSWWWGGTPKTGKGVPRVYSDSADATAGQNILKLTLPKSGKITKVELDAQATTEYFKLVDCYVNSPKGGHTMRLASGQLLPHYDARLTENVEVNVQPQSEVTAVFYGITAGVKLWLQIAILEDE